MSERPTKEGAYWFRKPEAKEPDWFVIQVESDRRSGELIAGVAGDEHWVPLRQLAGEFRGPIEPPRE